MSKRRNAIYTGLKAIRMLEEIADSPSLLRGISISDIRYFLATEGRDLRFVAGEMDRLLTSSVGHPYVDGEPVSHR